MGRATTANLPRQKGDLRPRAESGVVPLAESTYWDHAKAPLNCLYLLLPMVIFYEVGTRYFATDTHLNLETRIRAFDKLIDWLNVLARVFGKSYRFIPVWTIPTIFVVAHFARKDRWNWKPDFSVIGCMILEGVALCLPLFIFDAICKSWMPLASYEAMGSGYKEMLVLSVGAGLYEELVFRMLGLGVLTVFLVDLCKLHAVWTTRVIVVLTAVAFAWYHYSGGNESFSLQTFAFRTGAGIYFGTLFFKRGFGVTCLTHASYDILAVLHTLFSLR